MMKAIRAAFAAIFFFGASANLVEAGTIYVNTGGASTNSGSTDTAAPTVSGTAASWTSSTGGVLGAMINAFGTGYGASTTGTLTWSGTGCSVNPVLNVSTDANGHIISVTSVATAGTCTTTPGQTATTWTVGGALSAGSGVTISVLMNQSITLDNNTNLTGIVTTPGPTQSTINLANSTASFSQDIFWINSVTGCTGTGACSITVSQLVPCTTCTGSAWAIGGQYVWPSGSTQNTVEGCVGLSGAQDVVQFDNTPAGRTAVYFTFRNQGNLSNSPLTLQGKSGVRPVLAMTGNNAIASFNFVNYAKVTNFQLTSTATTVDTIGTFGAGNWVDNIYQTSGGAFLTSANGAKITNNEVTGLVGAYVISATQGYVSGNYFHGNAGDAILIGGSGNPVVSIVDNLITNNTGRGVAYTSTQTTPAGTLLLHGNTIANNTGIGIESTTASGLMMIRNNIIYNSNTAALVKWDAGSADAFSLHDHNVYFSSGGGTLVGLTPNSTESTSDPAFTNQASQVYTLQNSSPAAGTGFFGATISGTMTGFQDMGALQRQVTAGGGVGIIGSGF